MRRDRRPRVALVVENRPYRDALGRVLPRYGLTVVDCSEDPDVLLVDVALGGVGSLRDAAATAQDARMLAVGVRDLDREVLSCIEAGAIGYVVRGASLDDLAEATHRAVRDEPLASPHVIATLMRRVAALSEVGAQASIGGLTSRELEVAELIEQGLSNKEIAAHLSIAVTTVKNHVHSILEKLNVHRRGEAASLVRNSGSKAAQGSRGDQSADSSPEPIRSAEAAARNP
ncbi:MAG: response regulator transcription factor [Actinobacteria bacterium]|nr:MAG: response regulator transcription factor [Actinomycetota bacterium]